MGLQTSCHPKYTDRLKDLKISCHPEPSEGSLKFDSSIHYLKDLKLSCHPELSEGYLKFFLSIRISTYILAAKHNQNFSF